MEGVGGGVGRGERRRGGRQRRGERWAGQAAVEEGGKRGQGGSEEKRTRAASGRCLPPPPTPASLSRALVQARPHTTSSSVLSRRPSERPCAGETAVGIGRGAGVWWAGEGAGGGERLRWDDAPTLTLSPAAPRLIVD